MLCKSDPIATLMFFYSEVLKNKIKILLLCFPLNNGCGNFVDSWTNNL